MTLAQRLDSKAPTAKTLGSHASEKWAEYLTDSHHLIPSLLSEDPEDEYWDSQFGPRYEQQTIIVQALLALGDTLIVGGYFPEFLNIAASSLVMWNGKSWLPLIPGGVRSSSGSVGSISAIARGLQGEIVIAGQFARIGGIAATNLAIYDWRGIQEIPFPADGSITAVVYHQGQLYVAGAFESIDQIPGTKNIARWDGQRWHSVGGGIDNGKVSVLYSDITGLYVGGSFTSVGDGNPARSIARWDGTQWHSLGEGLRGETTLSPSQVLGIGKLPSGQIIAGGNFTRSGSASIRYLAVWDGTLWREFGPPDAPVTALLVDQGQLYISGGFETVGDQEIFLVCSWDGQRWYPMNGEQFTTSAMILTRYRDFIVAGGDFTFSLNDGFEGRGLARWNGTKWDNLEGNFGNGLSGTVYSLVANPEDHVYALGAFTNEGNSLSPRIARIVGNRWYPVYGIPFHPQIQAFNSMTLYRSGTLAVATNFLINGERIDGVVEYNPATESSTLLCQVRGGLNNRSIYGLLYDATHNRLICSGNFRTLNGDSVGGIAIYSGGQWQNLARGIQNGFIRALAVSSDGSIIVGGNFTSIGGVQARSIARWTGNKWEPLGEGISQGNQPGNVFAFTIVGNKLYVAGTFDRAGSQTYSNVGCWDFSSNSWVAVSGGTNGPIGAMTLHEGDLIVAGNFTRAGDIAASNIARYTLSTQRWSRLGSGIQGPQGSTVYTLVSTPSGLYVGGSFTTAGGKPSANIARWSTTLSSVEEFHHDPEYNRIAVLYPNPHRTGEPVTLEIRFPSGGNARVIAYSLDGRYNALLWQGTVGEGIHRCTLEPDRLPPGANLIVVNVNGTVVASVVKIGSD